MGWLQATDSVMERLSKAGKNVSSGFLLLMVLLINFEVLGRYFFGFSTLIADEYSAYFFVGCTFLGFSYSFRQGHFLRVSILVNRFSLKTKSILQVMAAVLGFGLSAVVTYEVTMLTMVSIRFNSVSIQPSATPLWLPQALMPLGMAVLSLLFLNEAIQTLYGLISAEGCVEREDA
jgi:TRAP-type C4-dicarboxylate transport system permease small subunit